MQDAIDRLNIDCLCRTVDTAALTAALGAALGDTAMAESLTETHPGLISRQPVYLSEGHAARMRQTIAAIERTVRHPGYQRVVLADAPESARADPGPLGVFMGYDFHLGTDGPQLIEINTNAGGALLNAYVAAAQRACCRELDQHFPKAPGPTELGARFVATFRSDWQRHALSRQPGRALQRIAIVDAAPEQQFLYPEFRLFQRLFEAHGIAASIADPADLVWRDGALWHGTGRVDLVYNRLTDFSLSEDRHAALAAAYNAGAVVLTPHPHAHALYADKRNLVLLTDASALGAIEVPAADIAALSGGIARAYRVTAANAEALWARRNALFFKPARGFGSKAAYRGEKVTRRVWAEILEGDTIAQELVPPSTRGVRVDGQARRLKADLRCYTYDGEVLLMAARLYEGQTTNMRTAGGGFAPVLSGGLTEAIACACG